MVLQGDGVYGENYMKTGEKKECDLINGDRTLVSSDVS